MKPQHTTNRGQPGAAPQLRPVRLEQPWSCQFRMYAGDEPGSGGDALQQVPQGVAFLGRQRRGDFAFEGASLLIEGRQQAARLRRQGHGDGAPVVGGRRLASPRRSRLSITVTIALR